MLQNIFLSFNTFIFESSHIQVLISEHIHPLLVQEIEEYNLRHTSFYTLSSLLINNRTDNKITRSPLHEQAMC